MVELLATGKAPKEVGAVLGLSEATVRTYIKTGAARLPGRTSPILKLVIYFLTAPPNLGR